MFYVLCLLKVIKGVYRVKARGPPLRPVNGGGAYEPHPTKTQSYHTFQIVKFKSEVHRKLVCVLNWGFGGSIPQYPQSSQNFIFLTLVLMLTKHKIKCRFFKNKFFVCWFCLKGSVTFAIIHLT